jgi:hypothetical protein
MTTKTCPRIVVLGCVALFASSCASDPIVTAPTDTDPPVAETSPSNKSGVTVVTNARVYTVDSTAEWAEAFAFDGDGVIISVGSVEAVLEGAGEGPNALNLSLVPPG